MAKCISWLVPASLLGMLLLLSSMEQALAQITSNVLLRVRMIQAGKAQGTSFTLDVDGRQYLITAKHIVAGLQSEDMVQILQSDGWSSVPVKVFRCDDPIDIAVLVPPTQLTVNFPLEPTSAGIFFSQDMFFVGFPYDFFTKHSLTPIAFIKKGIMSARTHSAQAHEEGVSKIFIDGHNNPGFSGGPIVFRDLNRNDVVYKVAGVVSNYPSEITPVLKPEQITREQVTPEDRALGRILELKDGRIFKLNDIGVVVQSNTGMVEGHDIQHALDLIHKNPIGPKTSETWGK
jgi:hypothetical protein